MGNITQEKAQLIIDEYCLGSSTCELADRHNLWQTSICNLISGRTWSKCKRPSNIKEIIQSRRMKGLDSGRKVCKDLLPLTDLQQDILVGSLLGDGCLSNQHNSNFSKRQSFDRKPYLDWHLQCFGEYSASVYPVYSEEEIFEGENGLIERRITEKRLSAYHFRTFCHPNLTSIRKQWYNKKRKTVPSDILLNDLRIAIWFFDDGYNSLDQRYAVICTQSFSIRDVELLRNKLSEFNLHPTIERIKSRYTGRQMPRLRFSKSSYDNIISMIKPYMLWDCFEHKIKWRPALQQWQTSGKLTEADVLKIFELSKTHKQYEIAEIYDVHKNAISALLRGCSYQHLQYLNPYIPKSVRSKKKREAA